MRRNIAFIGYDDLTILDLAGPLEVFDTASNRTDRGYATMVLSAKGRPFVTESGVTIKADAALTAAPLLDTVFVAGGRGLRDPATVAPIAKWLHENAPRIRRIASVCTGVEALAAAGLLDGRRAATHWRFASDIARRYPAISIEPDALFLKDGKFHTSAGVTAGIDLALALVEEDFGEDIALSVARELVVYLKRPGGQTQFSEPLQFQTRSTDRFADLAQWMLRNLKDDLSVERLADRAGLGARHFSRRFKSVFGTTPADYVEHLRLDEARRRLPRPRQTVDSVAASVGYASADAFRRAFERRFGIAPSSYRKRFSA
jgi:transcriptional regulator GlxA family with amidase domain